VAYVGYLLGLILIYWIAASGSTLAWRQHGLTVLCGAAGFGIGAYVAARASGAAWPFGVGLGLATGVSAVFGAVFGLLVARMHRDVAVVFSIAVQATASLLFLNLTGVTGGPMGMGGISSLAGGSAAGSEWAATLVVAAVAAPSLILFSGACHGGFGAKARAAGENPVLLAALGCDPSRVTARVFAAAFSMFGLGGALFAHYATFVHPDSFTLAESMLLLCMVVLGRRGGVCATGLGVVCLLVLPEALRLVHLTTSSIGKIRGALLGGVLCVAALLLARSMREAGGGGQ